MTNNTSDPFEDWEPARNWLAPGAPLLGPQEPPNDYRIYNKRQPDGTFPPLADFFDPPDETDAICPTCEDPDCSRPYGHPVDPDQEGGQDV